MSTLSLRIPSSLHEQIRLLAKRKGISINQFIAFVAAEKMAALLTEKYIEKRASTTKIPESTEKDTGSNRSGWIPNLII